MLMNGDGPCRRAISLYIPPWKLLSFFPGRHYKCHNAIHKFALHSMLLGYPTILLKIPPYL